MNDAPMHACGRLFAWPLWTVALSLAAMACGTRTDLGANDGGVQAETGPALCSPDEAFTSMGPVGGDVNGAGLNGWIRLSPDELTAYFTSNRLRTASAGYDGFVAHRASVSGPFTNAADLPGLANPNGSATDLNVTADGLDLLFEGACKIGHEPPEKLCEAHRAEPSDDFGAPFTVPVVEPQDSPTQFDGQVYALPTGTTIYFQAGSLGGQASALARATRPAIPDAFDTIEQVLITPPAEGGDFDAYPVVPSDEMTLYFTRFRVASQTSQIWIATRTAPTAPFGSAHPIAELSELDADPNWISPDRCRLYFTARFPIGDAGTWRSEIWVAAR